MLHLRALLGDVRRHLERQDDPPAPATPAPFPPPGSPIGAGRPLGAGSLIGAGSLVGAGGGHDACSWHDAGGPPAFGH